MNLILTTATTPDKINDEVEFCYELQKGFLGLQNILGLLAVPWNIRQGVITFLGIVPSIDKNWRDERPFSYWHPLGSSRVLYYLKEIWQFRDSNTINKKGGGAREAERPTKEKPDISATRKEWRI